METDLKDKTDEEILAHALAHPSVFGELVERYQDAFMRKARSVMRHEEDAEDVVQETFTKIYLHGASFSKQEGASFRSWAYKILMNTSFTHYQKNKRERSRRAPIDPEFYEMMPDLNSRPFEKLTLTDHVASVISRMPEELGRALTLHFIDGLPQADVAKKEGASVGAIKTRIHRAKKAFRDINTQIS